MINVSCVEYTTAIICASLPHLKALASTIIPGYFDSAIRSLREKRQSTRYSRPPGSMRLGGSRGGNNTITTNKSSASAGTQTHLTLSQHRRSAQQQQQPGVDSVLSLDGRRSSVHGHSSLVEGGSAAASTDKLKASWLADSGSEEYILDNVQPGEIWKRTEVEIQVGRAASYRQRDSERRDSSSWPL